MLLPRPVWLDPWNSLGTRLGLILPIVAVILAGCAAKSEPSAQLMTENSRLESELRQARQTVSDQQGTIKELQSQADTLAELGPGGRLELLFQVEKISLGRYTGGTKLDDEPGDDGVRVYLSPQDAEGRTITAAGSVEIDVFDLAVKDESLLMSYSFDVAEVKERWRSGALANHYNFTCPWKDNPPAGDEVTIRVSFTDYLTGKTLTATKQCRIQQGP